MLACQHCSSGDERHPQFVTLLTSREEEWQQTAAASGEWDYTRQPLQNLRCHNRERHFRLGPKRTKRGAPHHRNALVIAPFRRNARLFTRLVAQQLPLSAASDMPTHAAYAVRLAQVWHLIDEAQAGCALRIYAPDDLRGSSDDAVAADASDARSTSLLSNSIDASQLESLVRSAASTLQRQQQQQQQ